MNEESSKIYQSLQTEGKIVKSVGGSDLFFIEKARNSLKIAKRLEEIQEKEGLNCAMWIINTAYYSMFFAATALLSKKGIKINSDMGIHIKTYHVFNVIFSKKIEKYFLEEYIEAVKEAEELLHLSELKTEEVFKDYKNELGKRKMFTYNLGMSAELSKAQTSLKRAMNFLSIIESLF